MIGLDDMICAGAVYLHRFQGRYRCVWTPMNPDNTVAMHGIGLADTPMIAIARAHADAVAKGWAQAA